MTLEFLQYEENRPEVEAVQILDVDQAADAAQVLSPNNPWNLTYNDRSDWKVTAGSHTIRYGDYIVRSWNAEQFTEEYFVQSFTPFRKAWRPKR